MKLTIEIDCDNAAFDHYPGSELRALLMGALPGGNHCRSRESLTEYLDGKKLIDTNGNTVGKVTVEP